MSKVKKIIRKFTRLPLISDLYVIFTLCRDSNISLFTYLFSRRKNWLFMIAMHNNAGDLAQTVCIDEWLYKNYPKSVVINVAWTSPEDNILTKICKKVKPTDNVFIHSGYNITDICDEFAGPTVFPSHKIILENCKKNKIVFFPQSVEYKSLKKWEPIKRMYEEHADIVFISRDMISQEYAKRLLPKAKHLAYPDIVTTWIGKYSFEKPRKDVLVCLRSGAESLLSEEEKENLQRAIKNTGKKVGYTDTDVAASAFEYRGHRKKVVLDKISTFAEYKVIVTDRYHGTIFSLITGRPVIILKTVGHKVESAISWFPEEFNKYVHFVTDPHDTEKILKLVNQLISEDMEPLKSNYFDQVVYSRLKEAIYND
jgi:exopolysaccharide biosynthesis predicted pyruvyltransferase EpsI